MTLESNSIENNQINKTNSYSDVNPSDWDCVGNSISSETPAVYYSRFNHPMTFRLLGKPLYCESFYLSPNLTLTYDAQVNWAISKAIKDVYNNPTEATFSQLALILNENEHPLVFKDSSSSINPISSSAFSAFADAGVGDENYGRSRGKVVAKKYKSFSNKKDQINQYISDIKASVYKSYKTYLWNAIYIISGNNNSLGSAPRGLLSAYDESSLEDDLFSNPDTDTMLVNNFAALYGAVGQLQNQMNNGLEINIIKINKNKFITLESFLDNNSISDISGFNAKNIHFSDYKAGTYSIAESKSWIERDRMQKILKKGIWDLKKSLKIMNNKTFSSFKGFLFKPIQSALVKNSELAEDYRSYEQEQEILALKNKINQIKFEEKEIFMDKKIFNNNIEI